MFGYISLYIYPYNIWSKHYFPKLFKMRFFLFPSPSVWLFDSIVVQLFCHIPSISQSWFFKFKIVYKNYSLMYGSTGFDKFIELYIHHYSFTKNSSIPNTVSLYSSSPSQNPMCGTNWSNFLYLWYCLF